MQPNNSSRYRPRFYDIMPAARTMEPELSPFPGSLRLNDIRTGLHLTVTQADGGLPGQTVGLTVTDEPFRDSNGDWMAEVVFDRHVATQHPELPAGRYKTCCYKEVKLADLGVLAYRNRHWSPDRYSVEFREADEA